MLKKILGISALLSSMWFSVAAHAYPIGTNFAIVNNTAVAMNLVISQPNGQAHVIKSIPANETTTVYLENGDKSWWLYQTSVANFSLNDATTQTEYVNGRIAYYVGATQWTQ